LAPMKPAPPVTSRVSIGPWEMNGIVNGTIMADHAFGMLRRRS